MHFMHFSFCTRKSLPSFHGRWRLSSKVSAISNKLYLQVLLEGNCFIFHSIQDFSILQVWSNLFLWHFYILFFVYIFHIPKVFFRKTLIFFVEYFFVAQLCFYWKERCWFYIDAQYYAAVISKMYPNMHSCVLKFLEQQIFQASVKGDLRVSFDSWKVLVCQYFFFGGGGGGWRGMSGFPFWILVMVFWGGHYQRFCMEAIS